MEQAEIAHHTKHDSQANTGIGWIISGKWMFRRFLCHVVSYIFFTHLVCHFFWNLPKHQCGNQVDTAQCNQRGMERGGDGRG